MKKFLRELQNKNVILLFSGFATNSEAQFTPLVKSCIRKNHKNGGKYGINGGGGLSGSASDDYVYIMIDPPGNGSSDGQILDGSLYMWLYQLNYMLYFARMCMKSRKTSVVTHSTYGVIALMYIILVDGCFSDCFPTRILHACINYIFFKFPVLSYNNHAPPTSKPYAFILINPYIKDYIYLGLINRIRAIFDPAIIYYFMNRFRTPYIYTRTFITSQLTINSNYPINLIKKLDTHPRYAYVDQLSTMRLAGNLAFLARTVYIYATKPSMKSLLIYSENDRLVKNDPNIIASLNRVIPTMKLLNHGHECHLEDPKKLAGIVLKMIQ